MDFEALGILVIIVSGLKARTLGYVTLAICYVIFAFFPWTIFLMFSTGLSW